MPQDTTPWTRDAVLALPDDGNRYELLDGELLVSPSPVPVHQMAVKALYNRIDPYVRVQRVGVLLFAPCDLDFHSGQLLQPDLFVCRFDQGSVPREWSEFGIPLLVAEVVSPSTAMYDRNSKRIRYQRSGVCEYWIVDTDARLIERWQPNDERPEILAERIEWRPEAGAAPLVIGLESLFKEVWGESA